MYKKVNVVQNLSSIYFKTELIYRKVTSTQASNDYCLYLDNLYKQFNIYHLHRFSDILTCILTFKYIFKHLHVLLKHYKIFIFIFGSWNFILRCPSTLTFLKIIYKFLNALNERERLFSLETADTYYREGRGHSSLRLRALWGSRRRDDDNIVAIAPGHRLGIVHRCRRRRRGRRSRRYRRRHRQVRVRDYSVVHTVHHVRVVSLYRSVSGMCIVSNKEPTHAYCSYPERLYEISLYRYPLGHFGFSGIDIPIRLLTSSCSREYEDEIFTKIFGNMYPWVLLGILVSLFFEIARFLNFYIL